jgi:hypothetical protein
MAIHLTSTGLDFAAQTPTATGSMAYEILNHYEEGTWSPTSRIGTGTATPFTEYNRVGRKVTIWVSFNHAISSAGGPQYIDGLPWSCSTLAYGCCAIGYSSYTATEGARSVIWGGSGSVSFYAENAANPELSASALSGKRFDITGMYIAG